MTSGFTSLILAHELEALRSARPAKQSRKQAGLEEASWLAFLQHVQGSSGEGLWPTPALPFLFAGAGGREARLWWHGRGARSLPCSCAAGRQGTWHAAGKRCHRPACRRRAAPTLRLRPPRLTPMPDSGKAIDCASVGVYTLGEGSACSGLQLSSEYETPGAE